MSENRIALVGIVIEGGSPVEDMNAILHEYRDYVVGRMGIPYRERKVSIISLVLDAPQEVTSSLTGKLGMLAGVSVKAVYSKMGGAHV